jgi:hypothetical protein
VSVQPNDGPVYTAAQVEADKRNAQRDHLIYDNDLRRDPRAARGAVGVYDRAQSAYQAYNLHYEEQQGGVNLTPNQSGAHQTLDLMLQGWGLAGLGNTVWNQYLNGVPVDQIIANIRNSAQYKAAFPGMAALEKQGIAMTEAQYINYEQSALQQFQQYGIPSSTGYYSKAFLGNLIANNVSISELNSRLTLASQAATTAPTATRDELNRLYGINGGHLTAYWLDPHNNLQVLQQQYNAATLAGTADMSGYEHLSRAQAQGLAAYGVTQSQATSGFENLSHLTQLFHPLPGQNKPAGINEDQQLGAAFYGNAADQQLITNAQKAAQSLYGSGNLAGNTQGLVGAMTTTEGTTR